MIFTDALAAVFNDAHRIRRRIWSSRVMVGVEGFQLCIKGFSSSGPDDGLWHPWVVTESDFFADDWEVME